MSQINPLRQNVRATLQPTKTWRPDAQIDIDKLLDPAVKIFCLVNPSNPPSSTLSTRRWAAEETGVVRLPGNGF